MNFKISLVESVFIVSLVIVGILSRTILHIAPNVEFITAISLSGAYFLNDKKLMWVAPFLIMLATDILIGNTLIFLFTWSAFLSMPAFLLFFKINVVKKKISKLNPVIKILSLSTASGIISTFWFFIWTNFGVVVTSNMYDKSLSGLMSSYVNALPFLKNQMYGNLVIVPVVFLVSFMFFEVFTKQNLSTKLKYE